MRQVLAIAAILAMYGLIAYSIGIPLPPQPWLYLIGLAALETILLTYSQHVAERLVGEDIKPGYSTDQNVLDRKVQITQSQRTFILLVILCSTLSMTAVVCCQDSVWAAPSQAQGCFLFINGLLHAVTALAVIIHASEVIKAQEYELADSLYESPPVAITNPGGDLEAGVDSKVTA